MLVLTRKVNETIVINDNITITVLEIKGGRVRLGIDAPTDVGVLRGELWVPAGEPTDPSTEDDSGAADAA